MAEGSTENIKGNDTPFKVSQPGHFIVPESEEARDGVNVW